ncbi:hypothetical protein ACI2UC_18600 [Ralstonia nicotianae]
MEKQQEKTFAMRAPADFFAKLQWEAAKLKGMDPQDLPAYVYQAVTCASDAWHMADWVYHALPCAERAKYRSARQYRQFLRKDSEALAICREIADASKHFRLDNTPDPQIETRFILVSNALRVAYVDASRIASCLACWSAGKGSTLMSGPLMQAVWPAGPYGFR